MLTEFPQRCIPYAKEARLAEQKIISYVTAVDRTFDRREAFALARPYSALVVGCGTSFLYRDGVLCYHSRKMIRVLDVHDAAREEAVIDLEAVGRLWPQVRLHSHVELLHYRAGILSFLHHLENIYAGPGKRERWLIVIDVRSRDPIIRLAVIMRRPRIWVRNNERYLYVGSHDGLGPNDHREWVVQGYDLHRGKPLPPLPLPDFWGTDLRETVVFEIFDGYLHAVSNRSSFEVEEIDWTSFYFCRRFPLDEPIPSRLQYKRIWRRQHDEGPINDSWTDLGLHRDERTGELLIIEARKEWKNGVGAQKRTFYIERLDGSGWLSEDDMASEAQSQSPTPFPDVQMARLIEKGDHPMFAPPRPRLHCECYLEPPDSEATSDEFPISRTRYRTFLPASSAFLDVVLDDYPLRVPESLHPPRTGERQIRLRIGSRVRKSPLDPDPRDAAKRVLRPRLLDQNDGAPLPNSADRFDDRGIQLWPPANAPAKLVDLLNPGRAWVGDMSVMEDERSLVYRAAPAAPAEGAESNIVLINFDRGVRHRELPLLRWTGWDDSASPNGPGSVGTGGGTTETGAEGKAGPGAGAGVETEARGGADRWWRRERAMHLDIQKGYRFK